MVKTNKELHLLDAFNRLKSFPVLVVGDFLLDAYTTGRIRRISPEAPVPVMEVLSEESRPGGAGNVVLNLQALGARVICAGRIGADREGESLEKLLSLENVDCSGLMVEPGYKTPVKNRLIAESQQLLRVDFETISPVEKNIENALIQRLESIIPQVRIVALSDYGKGLLTHAVISAVIETAKKHNIPVVVDPKGSDFSKYKGASVLKPNFSEAYAAAKMPSFTSLEKIAETLLDQTCVDFLLITRSEAGMSLFEKTGARQDFPVVSKEVKDVTGAGDTVLAVLCLSLANKLPMASAIELSNIAAGIAIERLGCVQVTLSEIAKRLFGSGHRSKILEEEQVFALSQVLKGKRYSLLILEERQSMSFALLKQIRKFMETKDSECIVYLPDLDFQEEWVYFLSLMNEIDYIVLKRKNLENLCERICPSEVALLKGEELTAVDYAQDILYSLASLNFAKKG